MKKNASFWPEEDTEFSPLSLYSFLCPVHHVAPRPVSISLAKVTSFMQKLMLIRHFSRDQAHLTIPKGRDNYATASRSVRIVKCETA